jgi:hypothetical protein
MTDQHKDHSLRVCIAIAGIVFLESVAMCTGHNGTLLRLAFVAIAGLGGFSLAHLIRKP